MTRSSDILLKITNTIALVIFVIFIIIIVLFLLGEMLSVCINKRSKLSLTRSIQPTTVTFTKLGKKGRLGNQLFEIATVIAIAKDNNCDIILPNVKCQLYELWNCPYQVSDLKGIKTVSIYETSNYESVSIPRDGRIYDIIGYRQSYRYFNHHSKLIRNILTPRKNIIDKIKRKLEELNISEYIAIHIRTPDSKSKCFAVDYNYYLSALRYINKSLKVIVCSDTPDRVNISQISNGIMSPFDNAIDDFVLLYLSNHIVMSASTFSWMAAWLGQDITNTNKMVIMPSMWWKPTSMPYKLFHLTGSELELPEWTIMSSEGLIKERQKITNEKSLGICQALRHIVV